MTLARTWPNGYVSGWCSSPLAADHARCVLEHVDDRNAPGCHCKPCVAPPAPVVDATPDADLVALAAAAEWLGDTPEDTDAAAPATEPAAASVTTLPQPGRPVVINGDATALPLRAASVDAIVCDPPYELAFMAKTWDASGVAFDPATWREAWRVLKPGGYLLAFGGSRAWHRLACAVEDAGFELRDSIAWLYGSGFPKSLDVSKAIDKIAGAPATDAARQWQGWGTALKPAFEPIVVARKPLVGTVAANVQQHGTGALNIDGCRVEHASTADLAASQAKNPGRADLVTSNTYGAGRPQQSVNTSGRWPTNVVLSHGDCVVGCEPGCPVAVLDHQSGISSGRAAKAALDGTGSGSGRPASGVPFVGGIAATGYADSGGASRFFPTFRYQAKAPTRERPVGPDGIKHPTVKPLDLMRWLVRLVCPPGGTVLDMFAGSGTTGEACVLEGFACVLVEQHAPYLPLIVQRADRSAPTAAPATDPDEPTLPLGVAS